MLPIAIFVQNNFVLNLTIPVAQAVWKRPELVLIDRSSSSEADWDNCGIDYSQYRAVIPFGSVQMVRQMSECASFREDINYSTFEFATDRWIQMYGPFAANWKDGYRMPAICVPDYLEHNGPQHIRPNQKDKLFNGNVYNITSWNELMMVKPVDPSEDVFVSPPQTFKAEYRCWIVGGRVIQVSQYMKAGEFWKEQIPDTHRVWEFANALADIYLPFLCVVMDVVELEDGSHAFLEFNSIHSSGWYAADVGTIIDRLADWYGDNWRSLE